MAIPMLKIRRPTGRLIFNMGIPIPGKTVFLIETGPWFPGSIYDEPADVQIVSLCRSGEMPLSEPVVALFTDACIGYSASINQCIMYYENVVAHNRYNAVTVWCRYNTVIFLGIFTKDTP